MSKAASKWTPVVFALMLVFAGTSTLGAEGEGLVDGRERLEAGSLSAHTDLLPAPDEALSAYPELCSTDLTPQSEDFEGVIWKMDENGKVKAGGGCSAWKNCIGGCQISCTGSTYCYVGVDHVNCDGNKTYCNSCCTYGACSSEADCDPPSGVCAPDVGRCMSSGCCICA